MQKFFIVLLILFLFIDLVSCSYSSYYLSSWCSLLCSLGKYIV